jgi:hypothetical protein
MSAGTFDRGALASARGHDVDRESELARRTHQWEVLRSEERVIGGEEGNAARH